MSLQNQQNKPGIIIGLLIVVIFWALIGAAIIMGAFKDGPSIAHVIVGLAFVWIGLSSFLANRFAKHSWYFRLLIFMAKTTGRPIRDPIILSPIGVILASFGFVYALWNLIAIY